MLKLQLVYGLHNASSVIASIFADIERLLSSPSILYLLSRFLARAGGISVSKLKSDYEDMLKRAAGEIVPRSLLIMPVRRCWST